MIQELEEYETQQKLTKNAATQKMLGVMNAYYSTLKSQVGVTQQHIDEEDENLDDILKTLRPNTTPNNFRDFLRPQDNCNKTQAWRAISRGMHKGDRRRTEAKQVAMQGGPLDPENMKVAQLFEAFQTNYRSANQPLLEEPKQLKLMN